MNPARWSPDRTEIRTVSEMEQRRSDQWVLIGQPQANASWEVQSGQVLFASHDRDEVYRKAVELRPDRFAILFTGKMPADVVVRSALLSTRLDGAGGYAA